MLIASEGVAPPPVKTRANYASTKWCVDSGANRDICRESVLFNGHEVAKTLVIGEAGTGHSFTSQAEGPIKLHVRGKALPLFQRTILAKQVQENIMSVTEAVDRGYVMVFNRRGVQMMDPKDVQLNVKPILCGSRDSKSRLFYQFP